VASPRRLARVSPGAPEYARAARRISRASQVPKGSKRIGSFMMPRSFRSEFLPASLKLLMRGEPVILLLLGAVFALKVKMMSPVATDSFLIAVSQHDAVIFAAILLLYTVGSATIPPGFAARGHVGGLLTASARVLCLALIALYTIDVFVYYF